MSILLRHISCLVISLSIFPITLKAQCDICNFTIDEIRFNENIVGYYMAGFDLSTGDSNVDLFEYLVSGPSECYYSSSGSEKLELRFKIEIFSPELGYDTQETFVDGSLLLSDFTGPVRIKNTDINFSTNSVDGASLEVSQINMPDSDQLQSMTSYIMTSGKIPNGTYIFTFELFSSTSENTCGGNRIDKIDRKVEIYEPTFLDLQSPGFNSIAEADQSPLFTTYPNFIWNTDMCSACDYGIRVSKYDPLTHDSPYAALNDISNLPSDQSIEFYEIGSNSSVFTYPATGSIDLEQETYYVWQIRRSYETTVGLKEDFSDIFIFKIGRSQNSSSSDLEFLKELIGEELFSQYFGPNGELNGFSLTGIQLNGDDAGVQDLESIITKIKEGNSDVKDVSVE